MVTLTLDPVGNYFLSKFAPVIPANLFTLANSENSEITFHIVSIGDNEKDFNPESVTVADGDVVMDITPPNLEEYKFFFTEDLTSELVVTKIWELFTSFYNQKFCYRYSFQKEPDSTVISIIDDEKGKYIDVIIEGPEQEISVFLSDKSFDEETMMRQELKDSDFTESDKAYVLDIVERFLKEGIRKTERLFWCGLLCRRIHMIIRKASPEGTVGTLVPEVSENRRLKEL